MWAVDEYLTWLPDLLGWFLSVEVDEHRTCRFFVPLIRTPALILEYAPEASRPDRQLFRITGGFLARPTDGDAGEFEFRLIPHRDLLFTAIQQFQPALPWIIYIWTQARVHLRVMQRFGRHIAEVNRREARLEGEE